MVSVVLPLIPFATVYANPNYSVTWNNNQVGQYPLRIKSDWFKEYETSRGKRVASNNTIPITEGQASPGDVSADELLFVTIRANSFQSNRECEVQLKVTRPTRSESTIIVEAFKPADEGDSPACSDALIRSMERVVEPDGDNTVAGPDRDNDPNTDTEAEAEADRENVAEATAQNDTEQSCTERLKLSAGWIVCSILEVVADSITGLMDIADRMLDVDGQNLYNDESLRTIWSYFRIIATFSLLIIGLIMVISQAIGGGL